MTARIGAAVLCAALLASCSTAIRAGGPSTRAFEVAAPRADVFEAALAVAQEMNFNVAVLEKSSGLLRLEMAAVPPADLDRYCEYFEVFLETREPMSTYDAMGIEGYVSMTILLTEKSPTLTSVDLRANWKTRPVALNTPILFGEPASPVSLESKSVLEAEFQQRLVAKSTPAAAS